MLILLNPCPSDAFICLFTDAAAPALPVAAASWRWLPPLLLPLLLVRLLLLLPVLLVRLVRLLIYPLFHWLRLLVLLVVLSMLLLLLTAETRTPADAAPHATTLLLLTPSHQYARRGKQLKGRIVARLIRAPRRF